MSKLRVLASRLLREENGAALIEYSILIGLISAAVITIIVAVGAWIVTRWTNLQTAIGA